MWWDSTRTAILAGAQSRIRDQSSTAAHFRYWPESAEADRAEHVRSRLSISDLHLFAPGIIQPIKRFREM
jgi:hypothetical protein